jgi:hypothetical protein
MVEDAGGFEDGEDDLVKRNFVRVSRRVIPTARAAHATNKTATAKRGKKLFDIGDGEAGLFGEVFDIYGLLISVMKLLEYY